MKKPFKIIRSFLRGAIKSFPIGNAVIEGIENTKKEKIKADNITEAIDATNKEKPHDWVSILTQFSLGALFVYLFLNKYITVEKLEELIKLFF